MPPHSYSPVKFNHTGAVPKPRSTQSNIHAKDDLKKNFVPGSQGKVSRPLECLCMAFDLICGKVATLMRHFLASFRWFTQFFRFDFLDSTARVLDFKVGVFCV